MIRMVWKFVRAMVRHQWAKWRGYMVLAPGGIEAFRATQCSRCEHNDEGQCKLCKCLVISKTVMALERCPVGKWSPVWIKRKTTRRRKVF